MTRRTSKLTLAIAAALGSLAAGSAYAVPEGYDNFSLFQDDLAKHGLTSVLHDFNDVTADGSSIDGATVDGVTFSDFSISSGATPIVSDLRNLGANLENNTRSSYNAIGTDASSFDEKFTAGGGAGDSFMMTIPGTFAIGAWFITRSDNLIAGDLSMSVAGAPAQTNANSPEEQYNGGPGIGTDGVGAFFIGFIDPDAPIAAATVSSSNDFTFEWRMDDVYTASAPVASTLALMAFGAGLLGLRRRHAGVG